VPVVVFPGAVEDANPDQQRPREENEQSGAGYYGRPLCGSTSLTPLHPGSPSTGASQGLRSALDRSTDPSPDTGRDSLSCREYGGRDDRALAV